MMKDCFRKQNGFSLIELLIAFAMLSIVSAALLNMFVTSAKVNRKASDIDQANLKATEVIENMKVSADEIKSGTKYYKSDWSETITGTEVMYTMITTVTIPEGVSVTVPTVSINPIIEPYEISSNSTLTITEDEAPGTNIYFTFNGNTTTVNTTDLKLPLRFNVSANASISLEVDNQTSDKTAIIYVFNENSNTLALNVINGLAYASRGWSDDGSVPKTKTYYEVNMKIDNNKSGETLLDYSTGVYK